MLMTLTTAWFDWSFSESGNFVEFTKLVAGTTTMMATGARYFGSAVLKGFVAEKSQIKMARLVQADKKSTETEIITLYNRGEEKKHLEH